LRLFSFGGYGLALAALALVVFGAIECPPHLNMRFSFYSVEKLETYALTFSSGIVVYDGVESNSDLDIPTQSTLAVDANQRRSASNYTILEASECVVWTRTAL